MIHFIFNHFVFNHFVLDHSSYIHYIHTLTGSPVVTIYILDFDTGYIHIHIHIHGGPFDSIRSGPFDSSQHRLDRKRPFWFYLERPFWFQQAGQLGGTGVGMRSQPWCFELGLARWGLGRWGLGRLWQIGPGVVHVEYHPGFKPFNYKMHTEYYHKQHRVNSGPSAHIYTAME